MQTVFSSRIIAVGLSTTTICPPDAAAATPKYTSSSLEPLHTTSRFNPAPTPPLEMESESIAGVGSISSSSSLDPEWPDRVCACAPSAKDDLVDRGEEGTESGGRRLAGWIRGDSIAEAQGTGGVVGVRKVVNERRDVWEHVDPDRLSSVLREEAAAKDEEEEGTDPRRPAEVYPVESDPALILVVRIFSPNVPPLACPTPPASVSVAMLCRRWYNDAVLTAGL